MFDELRSVAFLDCWQALLIDSHEAKKSLFLA